MSEKTNDTTEPQANLHLIDITLTPAARGSWVAEVTRGPIGSSRYDEANQTERFGFTDLSDMITWLKEIGGPLP